MFSIKKDTNPKDAIGVRKAYMSVIPWRVIYELGLAMLEGALKYGRHNYRVSGVRASVYSDATHRHINTWYEGEDLDLDSGLSHITKAIASLVVLRDGMITGNWVDDRPPRVYGDNWMREMNSRAAILLDDYPEPAEPFTEKSVNQMTEDDDV